METLVEQKRERLEKPWLKQYPEGIPPEINPYGYASLNDFFEHISRRFATLPAYSNLGEELSYQELGQKSREFAGYLQQLGLAKGERVALMMPNLLQYPVALGGVLRAGLTVVNVNPQYTARELEHQLNDSGATAILVLENFAHTLEEVLDKTSVKHVITTQVGDLLPAPKSWLVNLTVKHLKKMVPPWHLRGSIRLPEALRRGRAHGFTPVPTTHEDVAFLQYTGGTTGVAKGAVLTHGNVVANLMQMHAWTANTLLEDEETAIIPLPLYHVFALSTSLSFNMIGANCVLITNPRDLPAFIETLKKTKFTAMIGVNTLYKALLDAPGFSEIDFHRLKVTSAGGMAVQRVVANQWKAKTGVPIVEGYGLSETSPFAISNRLDIEDWTGMIGLPLPSTDATILDEEGNPVAPGEVGEICLRGPQVMKGYWQRPDETKKTFTKDGWLRTGDMGVMNERGYFRITDRKKDMIIVSGFKVFPNELEDVVMLHPGVLEVGAIGVPDAHSGESVKLVVVRRDPGLTEVLLLEHCKQHLTGYKMPKLVEFRSEPLPKSNLGKILRKELRAREATLQ